MQHIDHYASASGSKLYVCSRRRQINRTEQVT